MNIELRRKMVTARKQHQCSLCTGHIQPGEKYERATLLYDSQIGDFLTCKTCIDDRILGRVYDYWGLDEGVTDEDAYEWACELMACGGGSDSDEVNAAKRYLERYHTAYQPVGIPDRFEPPRNPSRFGGAA